MSITIRNINRETDLEKFTEFLNLAHADYPDHKDATKEFVKEYVFGAKDFDENLNFLAFDGKRLIGRGRGDYETERDGFVSLQIIPEYRSKELMDILFDKVSKKLASRELSSIRTIVYAKFNDQIQFFKNMGFEKKFNFYSMNRDMNIPIQNIEISDQITIYVPDIEKEYDNIRNTIEIGFSDTMDCTEEMMVQYDKFTKESYFKKEGIRVLKDADGNMLGACIAAIHPADKDKGHIPWLAILRKHRRKGLGKALLLSNLMWLKENEAIRTVLSVEVENPNALNLYKSCGFEIKSELKFLEKKL